jgi:endogenous inhibitor of DNA gyrase (YacG/DUF329 family)
MSRKRRAEAADPKLILSKQGNFRQAAWSHIERANAHLSAGDECLIYAALELRMALEAITYDNAAKYVEELTPKELEAWQPPRLLDTLIKLDPIAAVGLEMQVQGDDGTWLSFGKSHRIALSDLRKLYNSLGSHLHSPSIKQVLNGKGRNSISMRDACVKVIEQVKQVLDAPLIDVDFKIFGSFSADCPGCGTAIKRRLNALHQPSKEHKTDSMVVECPSCLASFDVLLGGPGAYKWAERRQEITCGYLNCGKPIRIWMRQFKDGADVPCASCGRKSSIRQGLIVTASDALPKRLKRDKSYR